MAAATLVMRWQASCIPRHAETEDQLRLLCSEAQTPSEQAMTIANMS